MCARSRASCLPARGPAVPADRGRPRSGRAARRLAGLPASGAVPIRHVRLGAGGGRTRQRTAVPGGARFPALPGPVRRALPGRVRSRSAALPAGPRRRRGDHPRAHRPPAPRGRRRAGRPGRGGGGRPVPGSGHRAAAPLRRRLRRLSGRPRPSRRPPPGRRRGGAGERDPAATAADPALGRGAVHVHVRRQLRLLPQRRRGPLLLRPGTAAAADACAAALPGAVRRGGSPAGGMPPGRRARGHGDRPGGRPHLVVRVRARGGGPGARRRGNADQGHRGVRPRPFRRLYPGRSRGPGCDLRPSPPPGRYPGRLRRRMRPPYRRPRTRPGLGRRGSRLRAAADAGPAARVPGRTRCAVTAPRAPPGPAGRGSGRRRTRAACSAASPGVGPRPRWRPVRRPVRNDTARTASR